MQKALTRPLLLVVAAWFAATSAGFAQQAKKMPTAAELKKNLALVRTSVVGESDESIDLLDRTGRQLTRYLRANELSPAAAKNLGLDLTVGPADAAHLKVVTYSYSSGGTRGTIHSPVLQWKNRAGRRFAYALTEEEGFFGEIHTLRVPDRQLYLLLGTERGDSQCLVYHALVIELKGDYLLLNNKAFGTAPSLGLCNAEMSFDARKQTLRLDVSDYLKRLAEDGQLADEQYLTQSLAQHGYHRKPGVRRTVLLFRNGRFVQQLYGSHWVRVDSFGILFTYGDRFGELW